MNLQEQISRMKSMMGLIIEDEQKVYESKPIILIGSQGTGKSTTAKALAKKLGIPLIETDMLMIDEKYENLCKDEPGVEIEIKRVNGGINYSSNKEYEFCVMNKIFDEYGNQKVVLDVGGSHAHWDDKFSSKIMELFNRTPNIFIFNVSDDEDETYEFLKKRREGRGEEISPEREERFKKVISDLNNFYRGTQKISIINSDKSSKTTEELVDEVITKLT
jgi:shikimate kinase